MTGTPDPAGERLRRWRLVLGGDTADGTGHALSGQDAAMDGALTALYGRDDTARAGRERTGGLGASAPSVARWLGDIRTYFPSSVVQVMQRDAIDRLGLGTLLLEPEMLEAVEPDVHLVGTLLSLVKAMPETTRETARAVVRTVVEDLERRLATRTRATLTGALDRGARVRRPRHQDIDWNRTVAANLRHYLPDHRTVVPERLVGHGRARGRSRRRSCSASTSPDRWRRPSCTPRCSGRSSRPCGRSPPASSSSTPRSSTSPSGWTTPSTCSSARGSAAVRTSTGRSRTASRASPAPRRRSSC